jgi:hypothetical protein
MKSDELLIVDLAPTRLRLELDNIPLWRGDHVAIKQLIDDFARYVYLPRLADPSVLINAIRDGLSLLTWAEDSFAYADSLDEAAGRYRGLRAGRNIMVSEDDPGLLVRPDIAKRQLETETKTGGSLVEPPMAETGQQKNEREKKEKAARAPTRFHGTVELDSERVGRDASQIADEVISHLNSIVGADVRVTLEIDATIPTGAPEQVVGTVTENCKSLKFKQQGFESD